MQRIKVGLSPLKSTSAFKENKAELAYNQLPKGIISIKSTKIRNQLYNLNLINYQSILDIFLELKHLELYELFTENTRRYNGN